MLPKMKGFIVQDPLYKLAEELCGAEGHSARLTENFEISLAKAGKKSREEVKAWIAERSDLELAAVRAALIQRGLKV